QTKAAWSSRNLATVRISTNAQHSTALSPAAACGRNIISQLDSMPLFKSQQNSSGLMAKGPSDQNSFSNIPNDGKQHTPLYERASPNPVEMVFNASSTSSSENEENNGSTAK
ncbi:constitutive coactivator of PPAR-gamma-like protein 1 homolog isoform X1, partial [Tachysurus ichikawai]